MPVKHADQAKSRLATPAGGDRAALARAIALDSLRAAHRCGSVRRLVVVTSDPEVAVAAEHFAQVAPDPGGGLLEAVAAGADRAVVDDGPVAVLLADVPALRPAELAAALSACSRHARAFVPDAEGTGTVLLAAMAASLLSPAFGAGSAARHEAGGAVRLDLDLPSLRRDVDTWAALRQALELGAGPATTAITTGWQ